MRNLALIMAAGRGSRFNDDIPKQYHQLDGQYILSLTINRFLLNKNIDFIKVVINKKDFNLYSKSIAHFNSNKLLEPTYGCIMRQDSVYNGLLSVKTLNIDKVLIHDSVRPFIDNELIDKVVLNIKPNTGVMLAKKITDTVRKIQDGKSQTIDRENLFLAETPQGFVFNEIFAAHHKFQGENFTDDITLFEKEDKDITIIESQSKNIKITYRRDIYV